MPPKLKRIIRKATNKEKDQRHQTIADLIAELNNADAHIVDWRYEEGIWTAHGKPRSYRFRKTKEGIIVEKKKLAGNWRLERSLTPSNEHEAVSCIVAAIS